MCVFERERERERERQEVCVCVSVREIERKKVCVGRGGGGARGVKYATMAFHKLYVNACYYFAIPGYVGFPQTDVA